jgi:hemerythrin-like domain-containing protein
MTRVPDAPADTRMMGIVHDALRRDLGRAISALSTAPYPERAQRIAIGDHSRWLMRFLEAHHHGEDAGLWPLVRDRNPEAAPLLDAMESDHVRVAPLVDACDAAADDYRNGEADETRVVLLEALLRLREVLLPHLEREEHETMPLVSLSITAAEWRAVDQEYFIKPKSLPQLGFEGHWLLDGLDPERSRVVVHQVPTIPRFVLVHGFARRYRRHATGCWGPASVADPKAYGPAAKSPRRIPRSGEVDAIVGAPVDAVWNVVSDVTRVGEWSHECRRVEWLDGATTAVPGARFRGTNKAGPWRWSRINEVVVADAPRTFAWRTIPTRRFPDSSDWRIELDGVAEGTRITQSYQVVRAPALLAVVYAMLVPTHRNRGTGLTDDLRRLGELAAEDVDRNRHSTEAAGSASAARDLAPR